MTFTEQTNPLADVPEALYALTQFHINNESKLKTLVGSYESGQAFSAPRSEILKAMRNDALVYGRLLEELLEKDTAAMRKHLEDTIIKQQLAAQTAAPIEQAETPLEEN